MSSKHYNGRPCRNCNNTLRYVSTSGCVTCLRRINQSPQQKQNAKERSSTPKEREKQRLRRIAPEYKARQKEYQKQYRPAYDEQHREERRTSCNKSRNKRISTVTGIAHDLWRTARNRAKQSDMEFSITEEWVCAELQGQKGFCPMTGAEYSYSKSNFDSRTECYRLH